MTCKTYVLHLYSGDGEGDLNSTKTFYVNWGNLLPKKYNQFKLRAFFSSDDMLVDLDFVARSGFFVSCSIPSPCVWSSKNGQRLTTLGQTRIQTNYRQVIDATNSAVLTVNYPNENRLEVKVVSTTGGVVSDDLLGSWNLFLEMEGIEE